MDFISKFEEIKGLWLSGNNEDEWLFENFREAEIGSLDSAEAFELIGPVAQILGKEENAEAWTEMFETIIALARKSTTTEVPGELLEVWDSVRRKAQDHGEYAKAKFDELAQYYRIQPN